MIEEKVIQYLQDLEMSGEEKPFGLDADKVRNRPNPEESIETDDEIFFWTIRHHTILGTRYTPGLPMDAFIEINYKYSFNKKTFNISQLDGYFVKAHYNIDHVADNFIYGADYSSYDIAENYEGDLQITTPYGESCVINSLKDALKFAKEDLLGKNYEYLFYDVENHLSKTEIDNLCSDIQNKVKEIFDDKVTQEISDKWHEATDQQE